MALVTGASSGIGAATAARLRRDGWQVETAERSTGVDLIDPEAAQAAVDRLDRIDALVANAGTIVRKPITDHTLEEWDRIVGLNLRSVFVVCKAAAPRMVAQGSGAIVLVGSMTSFNGGFQQAAYAASKGGVAQLGKALSNELAGHGRARQHDRSRLHRDGDDDDGRGLAPEADRRADPAWAAGESPRRSPT